MTANSLADDRKHFNMRMETLVVGAQDLLQPTLDDCRKMLEGDAAEQEQALRADGKGEEYVLHMMRAEVQYAQQQDQTANRTKDLLSKDATDFPLYPWPFAKSPGLRYGYEPDSTANIKNVIARLKRIAVSLKAGTTPPYNFLTKPVDVADAIVELWPDSSWLSVWTCVLKFLQVLGHPQLNEYEAIFVTEKYHRFVPERKVDVLSDSDLVAVRGEIMKLAPTVYEFLNSDQSRGHVQQGIGGVSPWSTVQTFIHGLFQFGQNHNWVCLRADPALTVYKNGNTNCTDENYIESTNESECTVHYTWLQKVGPRSAGVKKNVTVDVGRYCPELAKVLYRLKGRAQEVAQNKTSVGPFFMFQHKKDFGKRASTVDYSTRGRRLINALTGLSSEQKNKLKNNTAARYSSVAEDKYFSEDDVADRCIRRGQVPTRASAAETHYAAIDQDSDSDGHDSAAAGQDNDSDDPGSDFDDQGSGAAGHDQMSEGANVRIHNLASPRSQHLNGVTAIVLEYLPAQQRYRLLFNDSSHGLLRPENVQLVDGPAFVDLLCYGQGIEDETAAAAPAARAAQTCGGFIDT